MRIATWSLQNPPIQKVYYIPHRLHGYSTDRIRTKNCKKSGKIYFRNKNTLVKRAIKIIKNQGIYFGWVEGATCR